MDFTTDGMPLEERYDILNKVDLIPIGTICYRAGDFAEQTEQNRCRVSKSNISDNVLELLILFG